MTGRPSDFTQEKGDEICDRLSEGEPLAEICRDEHMPAVRTVSDWKRASEAFSADFAHAREAGHDAIAARTRNTARGRTEADGGDSSGDVQRDKLIIETDLKLLSKWDKRYGDKLAVEHAGTIQSVTDEQLDARLAKLLGKAGIGGSLGGEGSPQGEE